MKKVEHNKQINFMHGGYFYEGTLLNEIRYDSGQVMYEIRCGTNTLYATKDNIKKNSKEVAVISSLQVPNMRDLQRKALRTVSADEEL